VRAAINDGLSHILFITKYTGHIDIFCGYYFIVGYMEIGWTAEVNGRNALRAKKMVFAPIEHAYEITPERWQRINKNGASGYLQNLRYATQRIEGQLLDEILHHLDANNAVDDYLREVARLKAEHNPYSDIPTGRIFIINIGANTSSPLQSPLFDDGRFELVTIPEYKPPDSDMFLTYANIRQFNELLKPLLDLFSNGSAFLQEKVHDDPEFSTLTFGDNIESKSNLKQLDKGDFLFFLARLVPYDGRHFNYNGAIFALVGYLEIAERVDDPNDPLFTSPAFAHNAHVIRWKADPSSFENFAVFKGSVNSRRFRFAVPFDREFVEHVPILKANGAPWEWGRTSDLGIIGSNSRTVRIHIDPGSKEGKARARRFWERVWNAQNWNVPTTSSRRSC
jgi:hypothetical protein